MPKRITREQALADTKRDLEYVQSNWREISDVLDQIRIPRFLGGLTVGKNPPRIYAFLDYDYSTAHEEGDSLDIATRHEEQLQLLIHGTAVIDSVMRGYSFERTSRHRQKPTVDKTRTLAYEPKI